MKNLNLLSKAEMKNVKGGKQYNPNCGETNPSADYNCCLVGSIYHIGEMDCDSASTQCANLGGNMITSDPSRC